MMWTLLPLLSSWVARPAAGVSTEEHHSRRRPVLFLMADDFRPQMGHLGFTDVETPNLDRLAKGGVSFTRAYCQAPVCNPSRFSFLTGNYPDVHKVFYFENTASGAMGQRGSLDFFAHARSHGFLTFGVGKLWHWGPDSRSFSKAGGAYFPQSYDQEWGCTDKEKSGRCAPKKGSLEPWVMGKVFATDVANASLFDYRVASDAIAKLKIGAQAYKEHRRPFVLGVGFHHPHTKWLVPRSLYDRLERTTTVEVPDPAARYVGAPRFAFGDINIGDTAHLMAGEQIGVPRSPWDADAPPLALEVGLGIGACSATHDCVACVR